MKKALSVFLTIATIVTMIPLATAVAFAEEGGQDPNPANQGGDVIDPANQGGEDQGGEAGDPADDGGAIVITADEGEEVVIKSERQLCSHRHL